MLDNRFLHTTPEGIDIELAPAGLAARSLAWCVDFLIRAIIYIVCAIVFSLAGKFGWGGFLILAFLLEWFYPVFFELFSQGMTPGKRAFKIKVVQDDGLPVNPQASILRNLLRAADFFPTAYFMGIICMLSNKQYKRLGDWAASTMVIYLPEVQSSFVSDISSSSQAPIALNHQEQLAIIAFAERGKGLSDARKNELANLLSPVLGEQDAEAVNKLYRIANGLVGHK